MSAYVARYYTEIYCREAHFTGRWKIEHTYYGAPILYLEHIGLLGTCRWISEHDLVGDLAPEVFVCAKGRR